jgi:hypothetical protein
MRKIIFASAFALVALTACGPSSKSTSSGGGGSSSEGHSTLACEHFSNIMGDVSAGILTDAELRSKISEVRDSATSSAVRSAATTMLAALTRKDKSGLILAAGNLADACKAAQ